MADSEPIDDVGAEPVAVDSFIELTDQDGGQVILNTAQILGVFEIAGAMRQQLPGVETRIMLMGGVNVPARNTIEEVRAVISQVAVLARGEIVESAPPMLYVPNTDELR